MERETGNRMPQKNMYPLKSQMSDEKKEFPKEARECRKLIYKGRETPAGIGKSRWRRERTSVEDLGEVQCSDLMR